MQQVTCPLAIQSAGLPGGYLPAHREYRRREVIGDDSAADDVRQIINPLGIGTARSYSASWVWKSGSALRRQVRDVGLSPDSTQKRTLDEVREAPLPEARTHVSRRTIQRLCRLAAIQNPEWQDPALLRS